MANDLIIGIDLGTSNSCVAAVIKGQPTVLANEYGERTSASVVHFGDGEVLVGNGAKARTIQDPKATVSSAKRLIGRYSFSEEVRKARAIASYEIVDGPSHSVRISINEREYSLSEVSAWVLREMKRVAEQSLDQEVSRAVVTVPAYFNDNQRQATKDAGSIAGLEVVRILNEPTAAALSYGFGRDLKQNVAVYDLGGGTFDVSILEIGEDVYEVLSTCGDTFLGGDDFDDRIIDVLAEAFQKAHGVNVRKDPEGFEKIKLAAETAKIELSENESVQIDIPDLATVDGEILPLSFELTRQMFEKLCQDLVQRTFKVCDEALQQAGLTTRDLDGVILVGGPTRLPTIREAVKEYFQQDPSLDINPDEVVAIGAAIHADSLNEGSAETYLLDVTSLSLRIGIAGGMTDTIIERNTPVPIEQTREFTTVRDHQDAVVVKIFQGESRSAEGNELLGQFEFTGFEPAPRGEVRIEVTFAISTDGIVKVSARDPKTGAERSTTVSMSSGLSDQEIQAIIARGEAERESLAKPAEQHDPFEAIRPHVRSGAATADIIDLPPDALPEIEGLEPEAELLPEEDGTLPEVEAVRGRGDGDASSRELFGKLEDVLSKGEESEE
jgi:molecular chaperone DnaK